MASFAVAGVFTIRRHTGKMMGKGGGGGVFIKRIMDDYEKGVWLEWELRYTSFLMNIV